MLIAYIAGPITNNKNYKKEFSEAEKTLKNDGYIVLNPAKLPEGMGYKKYMPICLAMIDQCDVVVMLQGWERSSGARLERDYALSISKVTSLY